MFVRREREKKMKGTTDTHKLDGRKKKEKRETANRFIDQFVEVGAFYKSSTDFEANSGLSYPKSSGVDMPNLFKVG